MVQHTAEAYEQPNWLHRQVCEVARRCVGIDTLEPEIERLKEMGYDARSPTRRSSRSRAGADNRRSRAHRSYGL